MRGTKNTRLRTVNLRKNFAEDYKYTNIFDVQTAINKIYNLALENNLGKEVISEWQQNVILVQSLVDNLATKSHKTALKDLKELFGGSRGLSEDNRRLVDSILRNSQREEPVVQQVVHAQMFRQGRRFVPPGVYQQRPQSGVCHYYGRGRTFAAGFMARSLVFFFIIESCNKFK